MRSQSWQILGNIDEKSDSVIMTLNNFNVTKITIKLNFVILITKNEVNLIPDVWISGNREEVYSK
ncbi:hypothetical protein SOASR014_38760 [Pectobacterium carotovorum subsp. carotovorum]|nr:hypothetical protein SOASR014_38760 [Pectobacterium carotovorum subsp. carotovorum]GLX43742.1 hypothetical protein Pcaca01_14100 [Pectobacterium carotovorum subsp. carotovorum]